MAFAQRTSALVTTPTPPAASKKLDYNCPPNCSLRREAIGPQNAGILKMMRENGSGSRLMVKRAAGLLGHPVSGSVMDRHLKHYVEVDSDPEEPETAERPNDIAILDSIIFSGFKNSRNWRPTIRDTLDAMKLKAQMTGQSAFEDMLAAMDAAMELPDEEIESDEAVLAPEERSDDESASD